MVKLHDLDQACVKFRVNLTREDLRRIKNMFLERKTENSNSTKKIKSDSTVNNALINF